MGAIVDKIVLKDAYAELNRIAEKFTGLAADIKAGKVVLYDNEKYNITNGLSQIDQQFRTILYAFKSKEVETIND